MNARFRYFAFCVLICAVGCRRGDTGSAVFASAHQRFVSLYAEKLDDAFTLAEMAEVEELLRQVPAGSADYDNAQVLLKRIRDGRLAQAAMDAARKKAVEELRRPPPVPAQAKAEPAPPKVDIPLVATKEAEPVRVDPTPEPQRFSSRPESITCESTGRQVKSATSGSTLLFVYASWCPACRATFPSVNTLAREHPSPDLSVVALSIDDSSEALTKYLSDKELYFAALRASDATEGRLTEAIRRLGGHYRNRIPYLAAFDGTGQLIEETGQGASATRVMASAKSQIRAR